MGPEALKVVSRRVCECKFVVVCVFGEVCSETVCRKTSTKPIQVHGGECVCETVAHSQHNAAIVR